MIKANNYEELDYKPVFSGHNWALFQEFLLNFMQLNLKISLISQKSTWKWINNFPKHILVVNENDYGNIEGGMEKLISEDDEQIVSYPK
jgi:hypothetical protein